MSRVLVEPVYQTVVGLEVHAQVSTRSKMYCGCSADYASAPPNTHVCPICMGLPGVLPFINRLAIETVIRTGLAFGCEIHGFSKLDRKNYFYPDLPKGYQISQYDTPLCGNGSLTFISGGSERTAGITRLHIEEDTGRLLHRASEDGSEISLVDLNRSGVPLMEIVGDPDLRGPEEARDYLTALRQILRYIGASTGNMEEGAFRCDANISIRSLDGTQIGEKVEIKNMNSFRSVERALRYEEVRQRTLLARGEPIPQETRGWIETNEVTASQRSKESAHDYRYFPEPDLPPLEIRTEVVDRLRNQLPELPAARRARFQSAFRLSAQECELLTSEREIADYFESTLATDSTPGQAKLVANWILNDLFALQRDRGLAYDTFPIEPWQLAQLVELVKAGSLTGRAAKELLANLDSGEDVQSAALRYELLSTDDRDEIRRVASATLAANPAAVADFKSGKQAALGRLIGETMRATGGRGKPDMVRQTLEDLLAE